MHFSYKFNYSWADPAFSLSLFCRNPPIFCSHSYFFLLFLIGGPKYIPLLCCVLPLWLIMRRKDAVFSALRPFNFFISTLPNSGRFLSAFHFVWRSAFSTFLRAMNIVFFMEMGQSPFRSVTPNFSSFGSFLWFFGGSEYLYRLSAFGVVSSKELGRF